MSEKVRIEPIPKLFFLYTIWGLFGEDQTAGFEYLLIDGGRGGGKSESVAQALVLLSRVATTRILCTREIQKSMKDSVYQVIKEWIENMGLTSEFRLTDSYIENIYTKTRFIFMGMKQASQSESLKSLKGVEIVWYEEAQTATINSLKKLTPTIRSDRRKIIFTFNQKTVNDAVVTYFKHRKKVLRVTINYMENIYLPRTMYEEAEECKEIDPQGYLHVWLGKPVPEDASRIVLPYTQLIECVDLHKKFEKKLKLSEAQVIGGFDVADSVLDIADKNSLATRAGPTVRTVEEWQIDQVYKSVTRIHNRWATLGFTSLYFDANAMGVAAKSEFDRRDNLKDEKGKPLSKLPYFVIPFMGSREPQGKDRPFTKHGRHIVTNGMFFKNMKSQGWWNLRLRLQNSMRLIKGMEIDRPDYFLSFDSDIEDLDSILEELSQAIFDEDHSGRIIIDKAPGIKEIEEDGKMKKRKSPNRADSIKYSFAGDLRGGLRASTTQGHSAARVIG